MNQITTMTEWLADHDPLRVAPLPDPVIDTLGHDPRSDYVERYWLGILGPSATWVARVMVRGLEDSPDGFSAPLCALATQVGLGHGLRRNSPLIRTLVRLRQFDLAAVRGDEFAVRRKFPPLSRRQAIRLAPHLAELHRAEIESKLRASRFRHPSELAAVVPLVK